MISDAFEVVVILINVRVVVGFSFRGGCWFITCADKLCVDRISAYMPSVYRFTALFYD